MSTLPPFTLDKPRYDMSTFAGRVRYFYEYTDPRALFTSKETLTGSMKMLSDFKLKGKDPKISDKLYWKARSTVEACLHPDTQQPITPLFRFAAFAPVNIFIVSAILLPSTIASPFRTTFIHWFNQSYNAAVNFSNRNASNPVPTRRLVEGYVGAVTSSVGVGLAATYLTKKFANRGAGMATLIRSTVPFAAVALAGFANVCLMRRNELQQGVNIYDEDNVLYGRSVNAGVSGLCKCGVARVLWNLPIMMLPPLIMGQLNKTAMLMANPRLRLLTEVGVVTAALWMGVPPALAAFPQRDSIESSRLEPQFRNLKNSKGQAITKFFYNKGL
eukprot:TRINITY_DN974_c0_g1_i1.p1 TRINITY_DN974_c0_g1~~TRINITY_DN974_c0_g1_i1.p1  ORF type:complete len:330 (-),score=74.37 TRINITY_DN974_c0_g1_i1:274-1263(-)